VAGLLAAGLTRNGAGMKSAVQVAGAIDQQQGFFLSSNHKAIVGDIGQTLQGLRITAIYGGAFGWPGWRFKEHFDKVRHAVLSRSARASHRLADTSIENQGSSSSLSPFPRKCCCWLRSYSTPASAAEAAVREKTSPVSTVEERIRIRR
jgi:hypothetical protein